MNATDVASPILYAEFPFRVRLSALMTMANDLVDKFASGPGDVALEVDGDRQRVVLNFYPDKDMP